MTLSLSKIRGFLAVAEHLHFRRAASALDISQPALSAQIRALEETLGVRLVARTTRHVQLTPDGERFLTRTRRLFEEMEAVVSEIRDPRMLERGRVAFSCIPTVAAHVFPDIIEKFKRRYPGMAIKIIDEPTLALERRIISREVDFGIGAMPRWREELEFTPIVEDPFVAVFRRDHPLAKRAKVSIDQVLQYPIISLGKGSNVRATIEAYFERTKRPFVPAYDLIHHYTIGAMVEAGLGITLLPSMATAMMQHSSRLKIAVLNEPKFSRHIGLIKRTGETLSPAAFEFYQFTLQAMKKPRKAW